LIDSVQLPLPSLPPSPPQPTHFKHGYWTASRSMRNSINIAAAAAAVVVVVVLVVVVVVVVVIGDCL